MGMGIIVCGLNGCGKSTLGKALAKQMGYHFIDIENLYFTQPTIDTPYANPRSRSEVEKQLMEEVLKHSDFVFSAIKGDYGEELQRFFQYAIVIEVPKEIRTQRVRNRSFQKFGSRMLEGGDLYEAEEQFFAMAEARTETFYEQWLRSLQCPVIRVDGTRPIKENVQFVIHQIVTAQPSLK